MGAPLWRSSEEEVGPVIALVVVGLLLVVTNLMNNTPGPLGRTCSCRLWSPCCCPALGVLDAGQQRRRARVLPDRRVIGPACYDPATFPGSV